MFGWIGIKWIFIIVCDFDAYRNIGKDGNAMCFGERLWRRNGFHGDVSTRLNLSKHDDWRLIKSIIYSSLIIKLFNDAII